MTNEAAERLLPLSAEGRAIVLTLDHQVGPATGRIVREALAAERLEAARSGYQQRKDFYPGDPEDLDAALGAERKATVERIRAAAIQVDVASHGELSMHDLASILDAEAAR